MLQDPFFETFVPSKSKVLQSSTIQSIPETSNSLNSKANCRVADLLLQFKSYHNAPDRGVTKKENILDSEKVSKSISNVSTTTKIHIGMAPSSQKLIFKLEIEANFDLRPLLICNDTTFSDGAYGTLRSSLVPTALNTSTLEQKLRQWADSQRCWTYPDGPIRSNYFKPIGFNSDTAMSQFWQEPSLQDVSDFSVMRSRKLKWQIAICSAIDELLLEAPPKRGCTYCDDSIPFHDLSAGSMESFYVLGSDIESPGTNISDNEGNTSEQQQFAKSIPISALFMNHRCCRDSTRNDVSVNSFIGEELHNGCNSDDDNLSCVLTGAKRSFIDRLLELGANPKELADRQEFLRKKATETWQKKSNRHISSAGRLQVLYCTELWYAVLY